MTVSGSGWRRIAWTCGWLALGASLAAHGQWDYPYYIVQPKDPWALAKKKHLDACAAENKTPCPPFKLTVGASLPPVKYLASTGTPLTAKAGAFLTEIADVYAGEGMWEPNIRPEVPTDAEGTRWAFMFKLPGAANDSSNSRGEYSEGVCNDPPVKDSWLALNEGVIWDEDKLFNTAAHELFHAVQFRYPAFEVPPGKIRCRDVGFEWFVEGTADGVGSFMSERRGFRPTTGLALGLRPYDASLHYENSWFDDGVIARVLEVFGVNPIDCDSVQAPDTPEKCLERVEDQARKQMGYMTSSFWRFLMDRYSELLEPDDPERLRAISMVFLEEPGVAPAAGLDWVAEHALFWGPFQHVYAEFVTEFASWPVKKYKYEDKVDNFTKWLDRAFGGCQQVELTKDDPSEMRSLIWPLHPVSAQCIQVTLKGFQGKRIMLDAVAEAANDDLADQLVLGIAREERGGNEEFDCYSYAQSEQKTGPGDFRCLLYGNTQKVVAPQGERSVRTWRFEDPRLAEEASSRTTFVLSNVHPEYVSSTKEISDLKITFAVCTASGSTTKSTSLDCPKSKTLDMIPNFSLPRRQALYGIKKKGPMETPYPMNMGIIEVAALDGSGGVLETYNIMPVERIEFGQTGSYRAMVMPGELAPGGMGAMSSHFCNPNSAATSIGTITRSDDEVLQISIDTPICELSLENMELCRNGCPKVDHLKADVTLAFGWRHFAEHEIEDLVTPAVQLDIDRYHHEVFGDPLPYPTGGGAGSGGDGGGDGSDGDGSGADGTGAGGGGDGSDGDGSGADGTGADICLCTCEEYEEIQRRTEDTGSSGMPDMEFMAKVMRCAFECVEEYRVCGRGE
ncbi:MAG: hypothetical protein WBP67_04625 [Thermoanaerobaculia bacterium]